MNRLEGVKVGDVLFVSGSRVGNTYSRAIVTRVHKQYVETKADGLFRIADGVERGSDAWHRKTAALWDEATHGPIWEEYLGSMVQRRLWSRVQDTKCSSLTLDQVRRIVAIIDEPKNADGRKA